MRDLLFKNLTSADKRSKVIASSEVADKRGVRTVIRRHFICFVREVKDTTEAARKPCIYVLKERNGIKRYDKFFCRIKGSLYAVSEGKIFLILFAHSLKINVTVSPFAGTGFS